MHLCVSVAAAASRPLPYHCIANACNTTPQFVLSKAPIDSSFAQNNLHSSLPYKQQYLSSNQRDASAPTNPILGHYATRRACKRTLNLAA
jgi:hypothetical protein